MIIFEWTVPPGHRDYSGRDDIPEAYRVISNDSADCGIVIEAKFRGRWTVNPWNTRTLVYELIKRIEAKSAR